MDGIEDQEEIAHLLTGKIKDAKDLLEKISGFTHLNGKAKLERRIMSELKFLEKLQMPNSCLKKDHILSSNLPSLSAIVSILETSANPVAVLHPFPFKHSSLSRLDVDVVANDGATWYKVTARNPEALNEISKGKTDFGQKSIVHQTKLFLQCADENPHLFKSPKVVFYFASGVGRTLASKVKQLGAQVLGDLVDLDSSEEDDSSTDEEQIELPRQLAPLVGVDEDKLFLDITCLVAYVSSMTNGFVNFKFTKDIYNQQAEWERLRPAKPLLDSLFAKKQLTTCSSAFEDFKTLVQTMGGLGEKKRTEDLIQRLQIIPDSPSVRVLALKLSSNVKERSRIIFGTADHHRIVIVTANTGFIRSAEGQGVFIAAYCHEPRVLTEAQEALSLPLNL
nr:EOG090X0CWG [Sida crystallina]